MDWIIWLLNYRKETTVMFWIEGKDMIKMRYEFRTKQGQLIVTFPIFSTHVINDHVFMVVEMRQIVKLYETE